MSGAYGKSDKNSKSNVICQQLDALYCCYKYLIIT